MSGAIRMSAADAKAHQRKHGFLQDFAPSKKAEPKLRRSQMNKTEHEYSLILESKKQHGEINDYKFEGVTLRWGEDPENPGKAMRYTPDFVVWKDASGECEFHEVKGGFIRSRDFVRFKGCRAEWARYHFELHQKTDGRWVRLL